MGQLIQNFQDLAITPERKAVLEVIEAGLQAIQPKKILQDNFIKNNSLLSIKGKQFDLSSYKRVFLIGFGKGSAGIAQDIEDILGDTLTDGYVIDNVAQQFKKIHFTLGTHPLPSQQNIDFTKQVLASIHDLNEDDLVLVVVCGGGSAMFESPHIATLDELDRISQALLKSGADIEEINVIRKHLSQVKGGDLAYHLYPGTVVSLIFSDVPGSDLSVIASGPTVQDKTTLEEAHEIITKYHINQAVPNIENMMQRLHSDEKYFIHVHNILIASNLDALKAMQEKAAELHITTSIFSDKVQGDAKTIGKELLGNAPEHSMMLAGGETTVVVKGSGKGGRNQTVVVASLPYLKNNEVIASIGSDGLDYYYFAGAIGDMKTSEKAKQKGLDPQVFLDNDNTYEFLSQIGDGIYTGKLESNVSDLMVVYKP